MRFYFCPEQRVPTNVMSPSLYLTTGLLLCSLLSFGQPPTDTTRSIQLREVNVLGYKTVNGIGHLTDGNGQTIYTGKKTEVILTDSLDANKAINNTRQILGRIPGLTIAESETGGFVANGIGVRGLNPSQSIEMNVRQNGYTIAADVYGYNETYYLPPMEAVARIEVVKGGASLAFGSQFGGMVNYVLKSGPATRFEYRTVQTGGSFGLFNSYHAVGGTVGKLNYFGFGQYRTLGGWRPSSGQRQFSGFAKLTYQFSPKWSAGLEYSALRNRIQMPGGLTDEQYDENPRQSVRTRNYLKSPWNVLTASLTYAASANTSISLKTTYLHGERSLVWFEKGPDELDLSNAAGVYSQRDIEREFVKSATTELRLLTNYRLGSVGSTLAGGVRLAYSSFQRREDGPGTNGSDFDLTLGPGGYEEVLDFTTFNVAPFLENTFRLGNRLSVTPGIRLESLESEMEGEIEDEAAGAEVEADDERSRAFALFGLGTQFQLTPTAQLYGNVSQAYRPITYADLTPLGVSSRIDPHLTDAKGYTVDLGLRGTLKNILNFDVGLFYLAYNNRIGLVAQTTNGQLTTLRTNVANSVHKGIESYLELNLLNWLAPQQRVSHLSIFDSFALVDARYITGPFKGNRVEYAPRLINRIGVTYRYKTISITGQVSHQTEAFGNATNALRSESGIVGKIPAYQVADVSATYRVGSFQFRAGINNLTDERYFTQRTDEYPGPGIIPSVGRNGYAAIGLTVR